MPHPQFGFTPPPLNAAPPPKAAIPPGFVPGDALHTGDGWVWQRLADGSVQIRVSAGSVQAATVLTPAEYQQVRELIEPGLREARAEVARLEAMLQEAQDTSKPAAADFVAAAQTVASKLEKLAHGEITPPDQGPQG